MATDAERTAAALALLRAAPERERLQRLVAALDATDTPRVVEVAGASPAGMRRVAVFSGSFNPLTRAHVELVQAAMRTQRFDGVLWSFSRFSIDKEQVTRAPLSSRIAVVEALASHDSRTGIILSNQGLYADQARALRSQYPIIRELTFLIGFDKLVQIVDPHYYDDRAVALRELFTESDLLVAPRGHDDQATLARLFSDPALALWLPHVHMIPFAEELRDLSSTEVRAMIARHEDIGHIVPPESLALVINGDYNESKSQEH